MTREIEILTKPSSNFNNNNEDWIEVKTDNEGCILGMEYHYADWFDHAERKISENSYLWDFAAQIVETER